MGDDRAAPLEAGEHVGETRAPEHRRGGAVEHEDRGGVVEVDDEAGAGVGFTMSIFISNLAFADRLELVQDSKIAVLVGSAIAVVAGLVLLVISCNKKYIE